MQEANGNGQETGSPEESLKETGCRFQDTTDLATRFVRLGLEVASLPLTLLPENLQEQARHGAADVLRGAAVVPRVLSGVLDEVAREVEVPLEESNLESRRRAEAEQSPEPGAGKG